MVLPMGLLSTSINNIKKANKDFDLYWLFTFNNVISINDDISFIFCIKEI